MRRPRVRHPRAVPAVVVAAVVVAAVVVAAVVVAGARARARAVLVVGPGPQAEPDWCETSRGAPGPWRRALSCSGVLCGVGVCGGGLAQAVTATER
ncbi:MAG: hypothetical protein ACYCVM_07755 [Acidiferrobacter sp.]